MILGGLLVLFILIICGFLFAVMRFMIAPEIANSWLKNAYVKRTYEPEWLDLLCLNLCEKENPQDPFLSKQVNEYLDSGIKRVSDGYVGFGDDVLSGHKVRIRSYPYSYGTMHSHRGVPDAETTRRLRIAVDDFESRRDKP